MSQTGTSAPDKASRVDHRPQLRCIGDAEGQRVFGVRVYYRHDFGPCRKDRRVNKALEIERAFLVAHRLSAEIELDDVIGGDEFRSDRTSDQKMGRVVGVSHADMAVGINHVLLPKNAVGDHQVPDIVIEAAHAMLIGSSWARAC
jgi:hypothetical protein